MTSPRFDDAFRASLLTHLARFDRRSLPSDAGRPAAVALVVMPDAAADATLVLTRRTPGLRRHSGQWALPGGRLDAGETAVDAALRELREEIGLSLASEHVLGLLDDFPTRSGFVITPVVAWGSASEPLRPDPREVAGIHPVPIADLLDPANLVVQSIPQSDRPVLALAILGTLIYSPTAAILHQFAEVAVLGRDTRVDHYEQPLFAWR